MKRLLMVILFIMCIMTFSFGEEEGNIEQNDLIDVYIIASALSMDFESQRLMPNTEYYKVYQETKAYFSEYKSHDFVKRMSLYTSGDDIKGDCIGVIIASIKEEPVNSRYRYGVFKSQSRIDEFLENLHDFYETTNAEVFFNEHTLYPTVSSYLDEQLPASNYEELLEKMIDFCGIEKINVSSYYTIYRPGMASFFTHNDAHIALVSPNNYERDPYILDIHQMVSSMIHEYLHTIINDDVKKLVESKKGVQPLLSDPLYGNMPNHRQVDEYLVRAIQGKIYDKVYSRDYVFDKLLYKDIKYGGFSELESLFDFMTYYDDHRYRYKNIQDFLPRLVNKILM